MIQKNGEYAVIKILFWIYYEINQRVLNGGIFLVINDTKLSSRMDQISEHINSSYHKIHPYDQMGNMIVNLSNKQCKNNNNSTGHINHIQKF